MQTIHPVFLTKFNGRSDNPGDMLIYDCLVGHLQKFGEVRAFDEVPWSRHDIPTLNRSDLLKLAIKAFFSRLSSRRIRLIIVYPPGAVVGAWHVPQTGSSLQSLKQLLKSLLWNLAGRESILLGASCYDSEHLRSCGFSLIGLRDDESLQAFSDVPDSKIVYCPDLSLSVKQDNSGENRGKALLSFREEFPEKGMAESYGQDLVRRIGEVFECMNTYSPGSVSFFCQVPEDEPFNKKLLELTGAGDSSWIASPTYESLLTYYQDVGIVISNRLHILLVAALAGALPIALTTSTHKKIVSLYKRLGWDALVLDCNSENIESDLKSLLSRKDTLLDQVSQGLDRERETLDCLMQSLFG
jgi:hypothetical protein